MTFAIAGVSGNTGKVVADALLARGKKVRAIVRSAERGASWKEHGAEVAIADLSDSAALTAALRGVEGAYLLIPPNFAAPSYREHQDRVSRALAAAVAESRTPQVVLLSSLGAQHERDTGPIAGLHTTELLLGRIPGTALSSLRAGYFLENFGASLASVKEAGVLPSFFPAALAFPMVGTRDIGRVAAELLLEGTKTSQVVELGTAHSTEDVAAALAEVLGKTVRVEEAPLDAVVPTFTGFGFSTDLAELYAEMIAAIRSGRAVFEGGHRRIEAKEPLEQTLAPMIGR